MDIILVRHAIAFEADLLRWPDDGERPLTANGAEKFEQGAAGLRRLAGSVDLVLSSPLVRAWQTAKILEDVADWPGATRCEELEPGTPHAELINVIQAAGDHSSVALVGHEPDLSGLASFLLAGPDVELSLEMKKGGAACLRFGGAIGLGLATLRWWATPKLLRSLAD